MRRRRGSLRRNFSKFLKVTPVLARSPSAEMSHQMPVAIGRKSRMKPRELLSPSDESRLQVVGEPKDKEAELVEKFSVNINFGRLHRSTGRPAVPLDVAEREDKREEQAAEQVRPSDPFIRSAHQITDNSQRKAAVSDATRSQDQQG